MLDVATYYLDTSIWIDHYENRGTSGEYARAFLQHIVRSHNCVLWSIVHLTEFRNLDYDKRQIDDIFRIVKPLMKNVLLHSEQVLEALQTKGHLDIPINDILHAILARDADAILVARDKHFDRLRFIALSRLPEDLV